MKITSYAVARPSYYDRNATSFLGAYDPGNIAPHGATTRITTTVGATKKLLLEAVFMNIVRASAASAVGEVAIYTNVIGASTVPMIRIVSSSNVVGVSVNTQSTTQFTIYAGETYAVGSYDGSTGGTNGLFVGAKGTLFDV